jgi:hypothetical protein
MLHNALKRIAKDFELIESEGGQNTNVSNALDDESSIINKLDRSVKFDEVDTVTFGLETDDGKIVKVYVNAEQAEAFEKALATKLGEIDDIEAVLNELSKEFEIVDVEWPEDDSDNEEKPEDEEDDGASALDQRVYGPDNRGDQVEDNFDRQFSNESLSYGEEVTLALLESNTNIESRFTTASQLMVYHAILDLGIPEIALARNPYRAAIIKGIKDTAGQVQKNASMKIALKTFIRRAVDFEKEAAEHAASEKDEAQDKRVAHALSQSKPELQGTGNKEVKEDMKISEDQIVWSFSSDKENLTIESKLLTAVLDSEETEKLIKGINNHEVTVCRDKSEDTVKKFVFSPRGSSVMIKQVGSPDGYLMTSRDIEKMLETAAPAQTDRPVKEAVVKAKAGDFIEYKDSNDKIVKGKVKNLLGDTIILVDGTRVKQAAVIQVG